MYMLTKAEKDVQIAPKNLGALEDDFQSVIEQATWANYFVVLLSAYSVKVFAIVAFRNRPLFENSTFETSTCVSIIFAGPNRCPRIYRG